MDGVRLQVPRLPADLGRGSLVIAVGLYSPNKTVEPTR
jgi:hypothetical protein